MIVERLITIVKRLLNNVKKLLNDCQTTAESSNHDCWRLL